MMLRMEGLMKRGGVWIYRRMVPAKLRPIIGAREIKRTLGTGDERAAKAQWSAVKADVDRQLAEAERAITSNPSVAAYKVIEAAKQERARRPLPPVDEDFPEDEDDHIDRHITTLLDGGDVEASRRVVLEAFLKRREDDDKDNPPLSIIFDRWRAERQPPAKTWEEWATARRRFETVVGADLPVRKITRGHMRAFKEALLKMPARRRGVDADGKPVKLSAASVQKQLNAVKSVLSWAVEQEYIQTNPATGVGRLRVNRDHREEETRRLPYDSADLRKLFASIDEKAGADRWLPLLALYTGGRLEELGQLRTADVRERDGVPYIAIEGGEGRRIKNRGSRRDVPLHPELIRVGFMTYVDEQRQAGHARLFSELKPDRHGTLTRLWGKRFRSFARSVGLTDPRKTFHSFRHGFKDAAREVMPEEHHDAITGHSNGIVGRSYGRGVPLKTLAESMTKVRYAGLTLDA